MTSGSAAVISLRRPNFAVGVVGQPVRHAEDSEQAVADELVHVSAVARDDRDDHLEELVEAGDHLLRVCVGRRGGEALHVESRGVGERVLEIRDAAENCHAGRAGVYRQERRGGEWISGNGAEPLAAWPRLDERQAATESLTAIKRAGADFVVTYWAKELAGWL